MTSHIRIRPTALIMNEGHILLIEYQENNQYHYNLPGGGVEQGESVTDTLRRELLEEANVEIKIGKIAFLYEYCPHKQSGDYDSETPVLNIIFDCEIQDGFIAKLPESPDPNQVGVRWIPIDKLDSIILYPNIREHIVEYSKTRRNIELIEDHQLKSYFEQY
ncbi:NUDIX domain-containing protein [Paenibacillus sp. FSL W7-1287]|uniref:NUDIX domain-containing protein n=1 Tax=Paenibacillus sp. FSL W7-1287 TaxID=2954538 RepID=UPI0030FB6C0D